MSIKARLTSINPKSLQCVGSSYELLLLEVHIASKNITSNLVVLRDRSLFMAGRRGLGSKVGEQRNIFEDSREGIEKNIEKPREWASKWALKFSPLAQHLL